MPYNKWSNRTREEQEASEVEAEKAIRWPTPEEISRLSPAEIKRMEDKAVRQSERLRFRSVS